MTDIVLATSNKNKIKEFNLLLNIPGVNFISLEDIGFNGEIVEDGISYEENSIIKACVPASMGYIGIADDSGLNVDCLGGAPGIYSARYAGENVTYSDNNEKLLKALSKEENRSASFTCCMSVVIPDELNIPVPAELVSEDYISFASGKSGKSCKVISFRGECRGTIIRELTGTGGFGYDPLFFYEPLGKTFAELTKEEKNSISHRGIAVGKIKEALKKIFSENC